MAYSTTFDDDDAKAHEDVIINQLKTAGEKLDNIDSTTKKMNDGSANADWKGADYDAYENSNNGITDEGRDGVGTFEEYLKDIQSARADFSTMMDKIKTACGNGEE